MKGPKFKNWVVQKMKRLKKPSWLYKVETLFHIIIYSLVFSSIKSCSICNPCCMKSSVQIAMLHLNLNCICNKLFFCCALNPINTQKPPNWTLTPPKNKPMATSCHCLFHWNTATKEDDDTLSCHHLLLKHKKRPWCCPLFLFLRHRKEGNDNLLSSPFFVPTSPQKKTTVMCHCLLLL
jgi:hypothetical protein